MVKVYSEERTPEENAALISAISRVYAAGLVASNSTAEDLRRKAARGDVQDFLNTLRSEIN